MEAVHFFTNLARTRPVGQWAKKIPGPVTGIPVVPDLSNCFLTQRLWHQDRCVFPEPRRHIADYLLLFPSLFSQSEEVDH
jgi:hypothetical protein